MSTQLSTTKLENLIPFSEPDAELQTLTQPGATNGEKEANVEDPSGAEIPVNIEDPPRKETPSGTNGEKPPSFILNSNVESKLKFPPRLKPIGRSKGSTTTMIGLPRKKKKGMLYLVAYITALTWSVISGHWSLK